MQPGYEVLQVVLQVLLVLIHRDAVDPGRLVSLELPERMPEQLVVEQREEVVETLRPDAFPLAW